MEGDRPLVLSLPAPRTLDLIFTPEAQADLRRRYGLHEAEAIAGIPDAVLARARYILGQPPVTEE
jgi:hypothetical protein